MDGVWFVLNLTKGCLANTLHVLYGEISPFCLKSLEKMKKSLNCLSWTTFPRRHQQKQSALCHTKWEMVQIPARSPELNPIENVFHIVWRQLEAEVKQNTITTETWDEFVARIKRNLSIPKDYIDKTIASMPNRINLIVKAKGHHIKY